MKFGFNYGYFAGYLFILSQFIQAICWSVYDE